MDGWQQKVQQELKDIRERALPAAYVALEEAQAQGDASQNPDTFIASEEIARLNTRIQYLQEMLESGGHRLPEGTRVTVDYGDGPETMTLSAAPGGEGSTITFRSPLGVALLTAGEGDTVTVGRSRVTILSIDLP